MFISLAPALTLPHTNLGENLNFTFLLLLQTSQEPRSSECCSPCSQLPLDGTKAHGKASGLQGGAGAEEGEHQLRCWHPAPMDRHLRPPSSTRGHQGETWVCQHQVQGEQSRLCPSALLQDSTRAESVLNSFTKPLSEAGSGISHLSKIFHFSSLSPLCSISCLCEGLGCTSQEPLTFVEVKLSTV